MHDKTLSKIICRIINLIIYVIMLMSILFVGYSEIYQDFDGINNLLYNYKKIAIITGIFIFCIMVVILVVKYTCKDENRLLVYRIADTVVRLILTCPLTLLATYYVFDLTDFEWYIKVLIGICIFIILNLLNRFVLQESLGTSFVISDEL